MNPKILKMGYLLDSGDPNILYWLPWRIIREIWLNLKHDFRPRRLAGNISSGCAGRKVFGVRAVAGGRAGRSAACCCNVPLAGTRAR